MKVLVPVDNSKVSEKAIVHALEQVEETNDSICFVHSVSDDVSIEGEQMYVDLERAQDLGDKAIERAEQISQDFDVDTQSLLLRNGTVVEGILEATEQYNPDRIYIGHRNFHETKGSVSRKLLSKSPVPVTVVTEQME